MQKFDDLLLSITGRIAHQQDFSFEKRNGEIANQLRAKIPSMASPGLLSSFRSMSIDDEGDISILTEGATLYVSADSVFFIGWLVTPKELSEGRKIEEISTTVDSLLMARGPLAPEMYQVRIFFTARFAPARHGLNLLQSRCSDVAIEPILGAKKPSDINIFNLSANYDKGEFSDFLELEGSRRNVQLRYSRDAAATKFGTYRDFLAGADLSGIIDDLRPFVEVFVAEPSKLLGRVFKQSEEK